MSRSNDTPTRTLDPVYAADPGDEDDTLGLTIGWHPDVTRVGDRIGLPREIPLEVSRLGPIFLDAAGRISGPLADPYVSRRPIRLIREGEAVRVEPSPGSPLRMDGFEIARSCRIGPEALGLGVVLEVAERVVLVLSAIPAGRSERAGAGQIIGESIAMHRLRRQIAMAAATDAPALLRGESGTGKELVAQAIHAASARRAAPYQAVNLAAVPASTAVAALFGHVRGAFTGADESRPGYFGDADGGTLFLDEIGDASAALQPMLLRALETGEVQPVGDRRSRAVDVRIIAATDSDLAAAVEAGRFRLPLLHRLAGIEIEVPPLRTRRDDAARLLLHFLRESLADLGAADLLDGELGGRRPWMPASIVAALLRHHWPGNVRELRNLARQIALGARDAVVVKPHHAPALARLIEGLVEPRTQAEVSPGPAAADTPVDDALTDERVRAALAANRWVVRGAARDLGVPRTSLYRYMENSPTFRFAADMPDDELRACHAACGGDVKAMAERLEISARALIFRLKALNPPLR